MKQVLYAHPSSPPLSKGDQLAHVVFILLPLVLLISMIIFQFLEEPTLLNSKILLLVAPGFWIAYGQLRTFHLGSVKLLPEKIVYPEVPLFWWRSLRLKDITDIQFSAVFYDERSSFHYSIILTSRSGSGAHFRRTRPAGIRLRKPLAFFQALEQTVLADSFRKLTFGDNSGTRTFLNYLENNPTNKKVLEKRVGGDELNQAEAEFISIIEYFTPELKATYDQMEDSDKGPLLEAFFKSVSL